MFFSFHDMGIMVAKCATTLVADCATITDLDSFQRKLLY